MESFTPVSALIGGVIIGLASAGLLYFNRQICGISGIASGCVPPFEKDSSWRFAFIGGLILGGISLNFLYPAAFDFDFTPSLPYTILSGFIVGFGTRLGKGCTSGHGVCGMGRVAPRSLLATLIFMLTGIATRTLFTFYGIQP